MAPSSAFAAEAVAGRLGPANDSDEPVFAGSWRDRGALAWRLIDGLASLHREGPVDYRERASRLKELCGWACKVHGIETEVLGQLPDGPAIFVSNHLGYVDPVVLCSLVRVSPIAKSEVAAWAGVGLPLERLNVSFVRRGNAHSGARVLRKSLRVLEAGIGVLNFPEGTTTRDALGPFHLGAFWLARRTGLPIVPIGMDFADLGLCWVDDEAFLPHYARFWWGLGRRVRVSVGEPIDPSASGSELELSWAVRRAICGTRRPFARAGVSG
jgi:1-acyl-sn-glycerol-3-phosphate acyltransferase